MGGALASTSSCTVTPPVHMIFGKISPSHRMCMALLFYLDICGRAPASERPVLPSEGKSSSWWEQGGQFHRLLGLPCWLLPQQSTYLPHCQALKPAAVPAQHQFSLADRIATGLRTDPLSKLALCRRAVGNGSSTEHDAAS